MAGGNAGGKGGDIYNTFNNKSKFKKEKEVHKMDDSDGNRIVGSKGKSTSPMFFIPITPKCFPVRDRRELIKQASGKNDSRGLGAIKRAQCRPLILSKLIFKGGW